MDYFLKIVKTSRPLFWFSHFTMLFYGALQSPHFHVDDTQFILSVLIFSLPFSLFIYTVNDFYDVNTDLLNPRKATIFGEKHTKFEVQNIWQWGVVGLLCSLFMGFLLGLHAVIILFILALVAYVYSAPPIRLKSVPLLDAVTGGGLYFYLIMVIGYLTFAKGIVGITDFIRPAFILFALLGMVGHLMGTVADEKPDRKAHINTSTIFFGSNCVISFCLMLLLICMAIARNNPMILLFILSFFIICLLMYSEKWRSRQLLQIFGGAYLPFIFFIITVILYFVDPRLLRI